MHPPPPPFSKNLSVLFFYFGCSEVYHPLRPSSLSSGFPSCQLSKVFPPFLNQSDRPSPPSPPLRPLRTNWALRRAFCLVINTRLGQSVLCLVFRDTRFCAWKCCGGILAACVAVSKVKRRQNAVAGWDVIRTLNCDWGKRSGPDLIMQPLYLRPAATAAAGR